MARINGAVRPATRDDVTSAAAVVCRAFADKLPFTWIQPDAELRARIMPAMANAALRFMYPVKHGAEVFVADERMLGIASWAPPGRWKPPIWARLLAIPGFVGRLGLRDLAEYGRRGNAVEAALHAAHTSEPHWYLATLAVDPDAHGQGVGSALVRSGLRRCDREGMPAYLECLGPLVQYYGRFGFEVTRCIAMPTGASDQFAMWRQAVRSPQEWGSGS